MKPSDMIITFSHASHKRSRKKRRKILISVVFDWQLLAITSLLQREGLQRLLIQVHEIIWKWQPTIFKIDLQTACQIDFFGSIQTQNLHLALPSSVSAIQYCLSFVIKLFYFVLFLALFLFKLIDALQISLDDSMHQKFVIRKKKQNVIFDYTQIILYCFSFAQTKRKLCPPCIFFLIESRKFTFSLEFSTKLNFFNNGSLTVFQICISIQLNIANFLDKLWKHHQFC